MSTADNICKSISEANNDGVCDVNNLLQNMSTADNKEDTSVCANCGKEGDDINNVCNKCKLVKYCNAACKKKHRHKHKKACEEHVRLATKLHDEKLFKQPPSLEGDCPICFLRTPNLITGWRYYECCGKTICSGCCYAPVYDNQGNEVAEKTCPFCRTPRAKSEEESIERTKKRVEAGDPIAIYTVGCHYDNGKYGYQQDYKKAVELWHRAGELGYAKAYICIGYAYDLGTGVEIDKKKATNYYELAAIGGDEVSRYNLALDEKTAGNYDRALKHFMIAVRSGDAPSLKEIRILYTNGHATIDDDIKALRSYQAYLGEIKSEQRDQAAAVDEEYRYY